jgi:iron complex outermembrane recepter protein
MKKIIGLLVLQLFYYSTFANSFIYGIVTGHRGEPVIGANVIVEGTFLGTATNADGKFRLDLRNGEYTIIISHLGHENVRRQVVVDGETRIDIQLNRLAYLGEEVIVSATRAHSRAPVAQTNLDRAEISGRDSGQDIPFILGLTPSFVASSDAGTGIGYTSFRIRGSDMERINITLNGIPLNDSESHGVWWVNMPDLVSSVDNIQIQRGVGTSSHGAGAFGASINLQTTTLSPDPYGEIITSAGSFNTLRSTVRAGSGIINDRFALDARLSRIVSDGYIERAGSELMSFFISGGMYNERSIFKINAIAGQEITGQAWDGVPSDMLNVNRRYNGIGAYTNEQGEIVYYDNETDNYRQNHFQAFYSRELSTSLSLNTALHYTRGNGYYEQYRANQRLRNYGVADYVSGEERISRTDLIRRRILDNDFYGFTWSLKESRRAFDFTLGGAWNHYKGDHFGHIIWSGLSAHIPENYQWYFNIGDKKDFNIFGKLDYRLTGRIYLYGDLQYRKIDYAIDGIDSGLRDITRNQEYHFFNPKAGIFFELDDRQNVYVSYARANREPKRSNFTDSRPGVTPRPERLDNIETGYNYRSQHVSLNANLFYMNYSNQLVNTGDINDVGKTIMTNVPESYRTGIEFNGKTRITERLDLSMNLSLSRSRISDFTEYVDNWDHWDDPENEPLQLVSHLGTTEIAFSPPIVAGSDLTWTPLERLIINLSGKYVDRQFIDNTSSRERMLDSYFFSDLRMNYTFQTSRFGDLGVNLMVANIFDAKYETFAWIYRYNSQGSEHFMDGYFPQAGRHFFVGLSLKF